MEGAAGGVSSGWEGVMSEDLSRCARKISRSAKGVTLEVSGATLNG
jgi:hypothetical protein